jgi:UDP-glucuronate 4-epimerase
MAVIAIKFLPAGRPAERLGEISQPIDFQGQNPLEQVPHQADRACPLYRANSMTILITGVAGFIANHLSHRLLERGLAVAGIDNLSPYYDVALKKARLARLDGFDNFDMTVMDLCERDRLMDRFETLKPEIVVHLAAQPGIRYSLTSPSTYVDSNLVGFANLLEAVRAHPPKHLIFASSSSVYGGNDKLPSKEDYETDRPLSFYAATKKANEAMAHSYAHLFGVPMTGVRFFTVYGPWGRPDMAFFKFAQAIVEGRRIDVYNHGRMSRDFTYIGDVTEALMRLLDRPPDTDPPYRILNIGNGSPVPLDMCIQAIEACLGRKAEIKYLPIQPGEVKDTAADISALEKLTGYRPDTPVETGIARFIDWYKSYFDTV